MTKHNRTQVRAEHCRQVNISAKSRVQKRLKPKTVRNSWYCNWILQRANIKTIAANAERNGTNAKWNNGGLFRQGYEGKQLPFFKGMISCIEKSNEGYEWNWDEKTLKGKKIGVLFGREQYLMNGQKKWATKARAVRSIKGLEMSEIPQDKLLDGSTSGFDTSGFDDEDESEEDLPF